MTLKQFIYLLPRLVKYNLKIIFAGKFIWFLLAAFLFFAYFMFQIAWSRSEVNEGVVYNLLMFPCVLLVFYPAVFGIQNDEDSRILEILFGIPDYKYKVWGVRLLTDLRGDLRDPDRLFLVGYALALSCQPS